LPAGKVRELIRPPGQEKFSSFGSNHQKQAKFAACGYFFGVFGVFLRQKNILLS
jgi:hypothetical protein